MSNPTALFIRFRGWATVRLATEPDPPDEPRGASGFTYAFAGEPPLDRIIRMQPNDDPKFVRSGAAFGWGVFVYDAFVIDKEAVVTPVHDLVGARINLHGQPKFESRNWLLAPPGWEPIVPFDLAVESKDGKAVLRRTAPLDPKNPAPVWQQPLGTLLAQGAKDLWPERETIGSATGIWNALTTVRQRIRVLEALKSQETHVLRRQCLESRLSELRYALARPTDARVMIRYFVERFSVSMQGADPIVPSEGPLENLDPSLPWLVDFWAGAFDCDLLAAFFNGSLQIPFRPSD